MIHSNYVIHAKYVSAPTMCPVDRGVVDRGIVDRESAGREVADFGM